MPDPTTELTFAPADPTPVTDGVLFTVTGPVSRGRIEIRDADGGLHQASPEFSQKNYLGGDPRAQGISLEVTGSPGGGTFKLGVKDTLNNVDYGETGTIAYNADAPAIQSALEDLVEVGNVTVSGTGPFVIVFGGDLPSQGLSVTLTDNSLTGGTSPSVALASTSVGASGLQSVVAGGPYLWGPIYLPDGASSLADVIATADDEENGIYEGDSLIDDGSQTVYDYGDI